MFKKCYYKWSVETMHLDLFNNYEYISLLIIKSYIHRITKMNECIHSFLKMPNELFVGLFDFINLMVSFYFKLAIALNSFSHTREPTLYYYTHILSMLCAHITVYTLSWHYKQYSKIILFSRTICRHWNRQIEFVNLSRCMELNWIANIFDFPVIHTI